MKKLVILFLFLIVLVSTVSAEYCYQESFNETNQQGTDGTCQLDYTGTTNVMDLPSMTNPQNIIDGTYTTYGNCVGSCNIFMYFNYSRPPNAGVGTMWRVKVGSSGGDVDSNYSLPSSCLYDANKIMLEWNATRGSLAADARNELSCWNSTNWVAIGSVPGDASHNYVRYIDEAMWWNITYDISECKNIISSGVYTLTQNIPQSTDNICINITANDVILDGAGFQVYSTNLNGTGVWIGGSNVTIKNLISTNFSNHIYVSGSGDDSIIQNITFSSSDGATSSNNLIYVEGGVDGLDILDNNANLVDNYNIIRFAGSGSKSNMNILRNNIQSTNDNSFLSEAGDTAVSAWSNISISNNIMNRSMTSTFGSAQGAFFYSGYRNMNTNVSLENNYIYGGKFIYTNQGYDGDLYVINNTHYGATSQNEYHNNFLCGSSYYIAYWGSTIIKDNTFYYPYNSNGNIGFRFYCPTSFLGYKNILFENNTFPNNGGYIFKIGDGTNTLFENITIKNLNVPTWVGNYEIFYFEVMDKVSDFKIIDSIPNGTTTKRLIRFNSADYVKNLTIENSTYGSIRFPNRLNGLKNIISLDYLIGNNSVYIHDTFFNTTAYVTLYGIGDRGFSNPVILKNGVQCTDCYNFTSLTADTVEFNVTSMYDTYSIGEGYIPDVNPPLVDFVDQTPADISTDVIFEEYINITYNITDIEGNLNSTNNTFFWKINNSLSNNPLFFLNGSYYPGITTLGNFYIARGRFINYTPDIFIYQLSAGEVLPATYNIEEYHMETTEHNFTTLSSTGESMVIQILNITNVTQYNAFEIMANSTPGASNLRLWYCNSSYTSGRFSLSPNCFQINTITANQTFHHTHTTKSKHQYIPFVINPSTGTVDGVKVTSLSYFGVEKITSVGTWYIYYLNETTRSMTTQSSINSGQNLVEQNYTIDSHVHQYTNDTVVYYYTCASDTEGNTNCSVVNEDNLLLGNLPPTTVNVLTPTGQTYEKSIDMNISWTYCLSPNGYNITGYNVSLYNSSKSLLSNIVFTTGLSYIWNNIGVSSGNYTIGVTCIDELNQTSIGYSDIFELLDDTTNPILTVTSPTNSTYSSSTIDLTGSCTDTNLDSTWYSLDGGPDVLFTFDTTFETIGYEVYHNLAVSCNDTFGNSVEENIHFYVGNYPGTNGTAPVITPTISVCKYKKLGYYNTELPWLRDIYCI